MPSEAAIVSPSWSLGDPPVPEAVPGFYLESEGFWLYWVYPEQARDQEGLPTGLLPVETNAAGEKIDATIPWPFVGDYATREDFISLGFIDTDP